MPDRVAEDLAVVKSEIHRIRMDVDKLLKILVEGNGNSLLSRVTVSEQKIEHLDERLDDREREKVSVRLAIVSAGLSFVTSMGIAIFEIVVKK